MCDDVDRFIVQIEETIDTPPGRQQRPVAGVDIRVELQVFRHVPPQQERAFFAVAWLAVVGADVGVAAATADLDFGVGFGHRYFDFGGCSSSDTDDDDDMLSVSP